MSIYLGNLSTKQIESRLGISLTDQERDELEAIREQSTEKVHGRNVWHCYDIPFVIACGSYEVALRLRDIFAPYSGQMSGQLQISGDWDGSPEPDEAYKRKDAMYREAYEVSRRLDSGDGSKEKLLGAWEGLTAAIMRAGLLDDFNVWRDREYAKEATA